MLYTTLTNRLSQLSRVSYLQCQTMRRSFASKTKEEEKPVELEIPRNVLKNQFAASYQKENGFIYDRKPFRMHLKAGKTYNWCLCGYSHGQPFCDLTHNNIFLKIKLRPIKFRVPKTGDYWLCNCKQTQNRPFCDGSHKKLEAPTAPGKK